MNFIQEARLKYGVWKRERAERKAEKQAQAAMAGDHGHGRFFLLHMPAFATICAAFVEVYWALLFCIEATGRLDSNFDLEAAWNTPVSFVWDFAFNGNAPVLLGLLAATVPIVIISMVWLPVQFSMRGFGRWRRGTLIAVGLLANAIVIISGTVVMNHNRQEQVRADLVIEQQADAGRAAIGARLQVAQTELARITAEGNTSNEARAARAGVAGWRTYVREAESDPSVPAADRQRIVRAMGSAEAADALRARIEDLTVQQATAAPTATTAANVVDTVGAEMNEFSQKVQVYRPPLIAVACTLIGILGAWWTLAMLLHMNPRDVLRSGWADESHRIEDQRNVAPMPAQPMEPAREVVTDAETGEELIKVKPREYWKRRGARKGQPTRMDITPEIPPDETGVAQDGGNRIAMTVGGPVDMDAPSSIPPAQQPANEDVEPDPLVNSNPEGVGVSAGDEDQNDQVAQAHDELPELSAEELQAIEQAEAETGHADDQHGVEQNDAEARQPETNPARMIAAE